MMMEDDGGLSGPVTYWYDTFTDTDGVLVRNHIPNIGAGYLANTRATQIALSTAPPGHDIFNNKVRYVNATTVGGPVFNVGIVAAKISFKYTSSGGAAQAYFVRVDPTDNTFGARIRLAGVLFDVLNGAGDILASGSIISTTSGIVIVDDGTDAITWLKVYDHLGALKATSNASVGRLGKTHHAFGQAASAATIDDLLVQAI